jgi:Zn-dependent M16 (insulinase) family peptidase
VIKVAQVDELRITSVLLEHIQTKLQFLHFFSQETTNNFFSITFRTPPPNDTGISHILEHLVLSGSHKYPIKDPFFAMLTRSMNTFMNAWTASDHTTYLFSTTLKKDYYNLAGMLLQ